MILIIVVQATEYEIIVDPERLEQRGGIKLLRVCFNMGKGARNSKPIVEGKLGDHEMDMP